MKDETKKKIKKGALIALQVTLGGFALLGMISTGALVKSCSKGEINKTAVVATTPVVGQRVRKLASSDIPNGITWDDLKGTNWKCSASTLSWPSFLVNKPPYDGYNYVFYRLGLQGTQNGANSSFVSPQFVLGSSGKITDFGMGYANGNTNSWHGYRLSGYWNYLLSKQNNLDITFSNTENTKGTGSNDSFVSAYDFATWALDNGFTTDFDPNPGIPLTTDYAYCAPVGTLPSVVPEDYTSVTLQFQADSGYGFPDTGEEIPGYTQIYSEGLVIDSYTYGGYLGNGMYNAIEIQCSRDSDPPADSCHISVSALSTTGFEYPEWKTLRVLGTHCTIYMADSQFDSDGVVHLQAFPDTGYYFDQDRAFIGNQLKEYYGAEVIMYDLSTGGLYLTVRKNTENLVLNQSPYIEITPLAGNVPVGGGDMGKAFDLFRNGFSALLPLLMIQVLPGITLGMLFMVPFIVILVMFILKVVHK